MNRTKNFISRTLNEFIWTYFSSIFQHIESSIHIILDKGNWICNRTIDMRFRGHIDDVVRASDLYRQSLRDWSIEVYEMNSCPVRIEGFCYSLRVSPMTKRR